MRPARGGVLLEHLVHLLVVAEKDGGQRPRVQPEDVAELPPVLVQLLHRRPAEAVQVPDEGEAGGEKEKQDWAMSLYFGCFSVVLALCPSNHQVAGAVDVQQEMEVN